MNRNTLNLLIASTLFLGTELQTRAQDLPKTQPNFVTIVRESVKAGKAAAHAKHEAGWPAALAKAKSPDFYLAMTSMTGPSEAWYVIPWESHAKLGESMAQELNDEALSNDLDKLAEKDAEYISGSRVIQARASTELSLGSFPDLSKARFFEISTIRIRPGHEQQFEEAAKRYAEVIKRGDPNASYRTYKVMAGMPGPTYIFFSSVAAFAEFDGRMTRGEAAWKGASPEELEMLQKCAAEAFMEVEVNRFRVDPRQSYVSKATREADPGFWNAK